MSKFGKLKKVGSLFLPTPLEKEVSIENLNPLARQHEVPPLYGTMECVNCSAGSKEDEGTYRRADFHIEIGEMGELYITFNCDWCDCFFTTDAVDKRAVLTAFEEMEKSPPGSSKRSLPIQRLVDKYVNAHLDKHREDQAFHSTGVEPS